VRASAVGGLRRRVEHERTGVLIEGRDPAAFAAAVDALADGSLSAATLSANAVELARRYTWAAAADRLRGMYQRVIDARPVEC